MLAAPEMSTTTVRRFRWVTPGSFDSPVYSTAKKRDIRTMRRTASGAISFTSVRR